MALEPADLLEVRPRRFLRRVPGRETFGWPPGSAPELVVKRTLGDTWREAWWERLHRGRSRSPGRREFENLRELCAAGLPVPRPLGWAERGRGARRTSLVVMEHVEHRGDLRGLLETRSVEPSRAWARALLELVIELHTLGFYHRDLYLQHVLVLPGNEGQPTLCLLDAGRVRRQTHPRRRWHVKDLAALLHSTPAHVPRALRLRFLAAYLDRRGVLGRHARRAWARAIEARRRRMACHVPRHGGSDRAPSRATTGSGDGS